MDPTLPTALKFVAAGVGGLIGDLIGGYDMLFEALLIVIALDYVTGVTAAFTTGELSSKKGLNGLLKKFCMLLVVILATVVDLIMYTGELLRSGVIAFFIANEGLSILENSAVLGVPIPDRLKEALEVVKTKK